MLLLLGSGALTVVDAVGDAAAKNLHKIDYFMGSANKPAPDDAKGCLHFSFFDTFYNTLI